MPTGGHRPPVFNVKHGNKAFMRISLTARRAEQYAYNLR
jgi:hypothetical protein